MENRFFRNTEIYILSYRKDCTFMFTMFNFVIKWKIVGKPIERIRNSDIFFKIKNLKQFIHNYYLWWNFGSHVTRRNQCKRQKTVKALKLFALHRLLRLPPFIIKNVVMFKSRWMLPHVTFVHQKFWILIWNLADQ